MTHSEEQETLRWGNEAQGRGAPGNDRGEVRECSTSMGSPVGEGGTGRRASFCLELSPEPVSKRVKSDSGSDEGEMGSRSGSTMVTQADAEQAAACTLRSSRSESVLSGMSFAQQGNGWRGASEREMRTPGVSGSSGRNSARIISAEMTQVIDDRGPQQSQIGRTPDAKLGCASGGLLVLPRDQHGKRLLPSQLIGVVPIPEHWPGELHLRDWIETKHVEKGLRPRGLQAAREAMILDGLKQHSSGMPLQLSTASTVISA